MLTHIGIVDSDGVERAVDVVVLATGFQAANYLGRLLVHVAHGPARRRKDIPSEA